MGDNIIVLGLRPSLRIVWLLRIGILSDSLHNKPSFALVIGPIEQHLLLILLLLRLCLLGHSSVIFILYALTRSWNQLGSCVKGGLHRSNLLLLLALLARLQSRSGLSLATDIIFEPDVLATFNFVKAIHRILLLGLVLVLVRRPLQHYFGFVHDVYSLRNH